MTPPRFAVIGTGRSGTGYMAAVFTAHRIKCGHEQWWTPVYAPRSGLDGDSSWLAVPDIETGKWAGPVLHVTRHPVDVVRSQLGGGLFSQSPTYPQFLAFALTHEPELVGMTLLERAVEWWVRWNRRCAAVADLTIDVGDLVAQLDTVADVIDHPLDTHTVETVPATVNHRHRATVDEGDIWDLLDGRADAFGYCRDTGSTVD